MDMVVSLRQHSWKHTIQKSAETALIFRNVHLFSRIVSKINSDIEQFLAIWSKSICIHNHILNIAKPTSGAEVKNNRRRLSYWPLRHNFHSAHPGLSSFFNVIKLKLIFIIK